MFDISEFIRLALKEDIGTGDHTSLACIPENTTGKAHLLVKEPGVIAGVRIAEEIFRIYDPKLKFSKLLVDGDIVKVNDIVFVVEGSERFILQQVQDERVLDFLKRKCDDK